MIEILRDYVNNGQWSEARALADQLMDSMMESSTYWLLNAAIYNAEQLEQGEYMCISKGLHCDPCNYELYYMLGNYYLPHNANQAWLCYENALFYCSSQEDRSLIMESMNNIDKLVDVHPMSIIILSFNSCDIILK